MDQSFTSTGVVILNEKEEIIKTCVISSPKTVDFFDRASIISQSINQIIINYKPSFITLEGLAFGGIGNATRQLSGLQYTIVLNIRQLKLDCTIVPPTNLKKFATGKGSAKKDDMYDILPDYFKIYLKEKGIKKSSGLGDIVDAYWLARYQLDLIYPKLTLINI
ncbi:MAG: crossover junction endodeoxyribonuclease RuvC [Nitrososphaeraceae archaeon]